MKLPLIYADLHWSETSSILRKSSNKYQNYTSRLEHLIDTLNQIEQHAQNIGSDTIISLGDTFDKAVLTAQEITALQEVQFNPNIRHIFLVGNHEISTRATQTSTTHLFNLIPNCEVIDSPKVMDFGQYEIAFLPYIIEQGRKPIQEYFNKPNKYRLLLSHNDIKGIQMGAFLSQDGFSIEDLEENCSLCINGHLHNAQAISSKIINIGNVCGQNFSEDAFKYEHCYFVFDTATKNFFPYKNPFSLNFYKVDLVGLSEEEIKNTLHRLQNNSIISIKVDEKHSSAVKDIIENNTNIIESRILINTETSVLSKNKDNKVLSVNHIEQFVQYVKENVGNNEIVKYELQEILK